jgi:hypothetical protein
MNLFELIFAVLILSTSISAGAYGWRDHGWIGGLVGIIAGAAGGWVAGVILAIILGAILSVATRTPFFGRGTSGDQHK